MKIGIFTQFGKLNTGQLIGGGHLSRMMTFATAAKNLGHEIIFILNQEISLEAQKGFEFIQEAHGNTYPYNFLDVGFFDIKIDLNSKVENFGRICKKIAIIDDNADKPIKCDLIINHNIHAQTLDYSNYIANKFLLGPEFGLVNPEFAQVGKIPISKREEIIICFGANDESGIGIEVGKAICEKYPNQIVNLAIGNAVLDDSQIKHDNLKIHRMAHMPTLMAKSWLYIGNAGVTLLESLCAKLYIIIAPMAEDQKKACNFLANSSVENVCAADAKELTNRVIEVIDSKLENNLVWPNYKFAIPGGKGADKLLNEIQNIFNEEV